MKMTVQKMGDQAFLNVVYAPEDLTPADLAAQRDQVAEALKKHSLNLVLIDTTALPQFPQVVTIFEHNRAVSTQKELQKSKFAVLVNSVGKKEKFLEDSGVNRGLRIKCFTSQEKALNWLK